MSPQYYTLPCFSGYPHVTKDQAQNLKDKFFQRLTYALKDNAKVLFNGELVDPFWLIADRLGRRCPELTNEAVLVPVPRSSVTPADVESVHWPARKIAHALTRAGLCDRMVISLRRAIPVPKASQAKSSSDRPTVMKHMETLAVDLSRVKDARRIILVDDVTTRGTQMMGAMRAFQLAGFTGEIRGFAAGHTDYGARTVAFRSIITWNGVDDYPSQAPEAQAQSVLPVRPTA